MKLKDLIDSNNWLSVKLILLELYPDQEVVLEEYQNVFDQLKFSQPENSDMSIVLTEYDSDSDEEDETESYVDVSGKKRVKEENLQTDSYAIEFVKWKEWLGMDLAPQTIDNFTELEIIAHCLYEMTFISFDEKEIQEQLDTLKERVEEYKGLTDEEKNEKTISWDELKEKLNKRGDRQQ